MSLARRCAIGLLASLATAAAAQDVAIPPPGSEAWQPLTFPKIERHTRYTTRPGQPPGARDAA